MGDTDAPAGTYVDVLSSNRQSKEPSRPVKLRPGSIHPRARKGRSANFGCRRFSEGRYERTKYHPFGGYPDPPGLVTPGASAPVGSVSEGGCSIRLFVKVLSVMMA